MLSRALGRRSFGWKSAQTHPRLLSPSNRAISTNNGFLKISEEVLEAIHSKKPIVALETTIYTHGRMMAHFTNQG